MEDFFFNLMPVDFDELLAEPLPPVDQMTDRQYEADAIADAIAA